MPFQSEIKRGDVLRVRLDPIVGSEQAGERPALVLSPDFHNRYSRLILVAAITSQKTDKLYPFEALIEPPDGGLIVRSKVMMTHLRSIDKTRILSRYGAISFETMARVETALKLATGLTIV